MSYPGTFNKRRGLPKNSRSGETRCVSSRPRVGSLTSCLTAERPEVVHLQPLVVVETAEAATDTQSIPVFPRLRHPRAVLVGEESIVASDGEFEP